MATTGQVGGGQIEPRRDEDQISTERQEGEEEEEEEEARKGGEGLGVERSRRLLIVSIRERDHRWD